MTNQATINFIREHREDDVRQLALGGSRNPDVDLCYALEQIQGWQTARKKLPLWAAHEAIVYPPHLNMEQCSSEQTASYKQQIVRRLLGDALASASLVDLTGGFGVDFFYLSAGFSRSLYVERDAELCAVVRHNLNVLGRQQAEVWCRDSETVLDSLSVDKERSATTVVFLDPARRGAHGQRVFGLQDCEPDVTLLRQRLLDISDVLLLKLSPMLDWHEALHQLCPGGRGCEVHIVSVGNECKELVLVITGRDTPLRVFCVNDNEQFVFMPQEPVAPTIQKFADLSPQAVGKWLLVPNASVMKAGCFYELSAHFDVLLVAPNSHLFLSHNPIPDFPGRIFRITAVSSFNKKALKATLADIDRANIATRNFPLSVAELRRRLKLKDGGSHYLFATTDANNDKWLLIAQKA